jgi:hydrogenase expression/formation protein HypE
MGDSTILPSDLAAGRLAFSTDSYVINPLFFPGGDIGELAVNGTVNDLAMSGARPLFLSCGFILEEGLEMKTLGLIVKSMAQACRIAKVLMVAGDTKVVNKGHDGMYINTTGIGMINNEIDIRLQMLNLEMQFHSGVGRSGLLLCPFAVLSLSQLSKAHARH